MASFFRESYMDSLNAGVLPKFLLLIATVAMGNTVQAYVSTYATRELYAGRPGMVTTLGTRTFGTWTFLSAVIRAYAALHIYNRQVYELALSSFVIAMLHFTSELLVFRTCIINRASIGPLIVGTLGTVWMTMQWSAYVK